MAARRKTRAREVQLGFEALTIEGGLLSPEWLSRAAQLAAGGQNEGAYRIPKGLNLRDEIGRYWRIAQAHWSELCAGSAAKADQRVLAERFVGALLRETFGFEDLATTDPVVIAERSYQIGFSALGGRVPVVIAPVESGLDTVALTFGDGGRRRSAFGLAQEYLNAQDRSLWGLVCDGVTLRIIRDNASLTRPAWIEADLQRIFTEERYADFAALWLLVHETRFGRADQPVTECALETWRNAGREEGTRAREHLRRGVEDALLALGQGFLSCPENQALRADLQNGSLSTKAYFNQLLRLVYRLIFLLTVEERGLLHPEGTDEKARALYTQGYGLRRLRERSVKRSAHDRYLDLWEATKIVFGGVATGEPRLGLPALAGLFAKSQCPALDGAKIENRAILLAVFRLAWLREDSSLARVNWRDMGPEELGSVYESLLELVPQITKDGRQFAFASGGETKGNARKTTGSYYTPDSLVQVLLDSALEPVIVDTIAKNPEKPADALLGLSIVDPACGSGHFLLAAARRLAAHVARLQANGTPSAAEYRRALRQVVGHCIYGVDLNPMAVELCKVSLWMEAVEPGLPLTFLNSHVQCGNALLGTVPKLMTDGVPDGAWQPLEGDDKKITSALKKRNKSAAEGQRGFESLWSNSDTSETAEVARDHELLEAASDSDYSALALKESRWQKILASDAYRHQRFVADLWCAAFVWPKRPGLLADAAPTNDLWRQIRDAQGHPPPLTVATTEELAQTYSFHHWHLAFPLVFARGGFDVVLGNPPWERVKVQEQEFFASRNDQIAAAPNAAARKKLIAALLETDPRLWSEWCAATREADGQGNFVRQSARYPLCGKGDVNTYALFAEHNISILADRGQAGFIVPTGIATDDTTKNYFRSIVDGGRLRTLYDFQSGPGIFGAIGHGTFKFSLITVSGAKGSGFPMLSFYSRSVGEATSAEKVFTLSPVDIELLNPNTRTCSIFRARRDADINLALYRRTGVLWREDITGGNPWGLRFMRMFDMANDSGLFRTRAELNQANCRLVGSRFESSEGQYVPLYEAKMLSHFDHRFGDYRDHPHGSENLSLPDVPLDRLTDPAYEPVGRYWIHGSALEAKIPQEWVNNWVLGWRDTTKPQNERTLIACVIPRVAIGHKFLLMMPTAEPRLIAALYANLCSVALDYCSRQKVGGTSLNYFIMKQLPVLGPSTYVIKTPWSRGIKLIDWILPRVLELTYTAWDLESFARDIGHIGPPFRWDTLRRQQLRAELDAAFFHLYDLAPEDVAYVLDTFPIVRKNDEKAHGEYRTKRVILEIYNAMADAARSGTPYQTRLEPAPADPRVAHEPRVSDIPAIPSVVPALQPDQETAILIWAILHAHGGSIPRIDLARAFALRARPDLLVQFAPAALAETVRSWASKVGQKDVAPGLLIKALAALSDRGGVELTTDASSRSVVKLSPSTPSDDQIDPWFRFEARLALHVLRSQPGRALGTIDAAVAGADRALLEQAS